MDTTGDSNWSNGLFGCLPHLSFRRLLHGLFFVSQLFGVAPVLNGRAALRHLHRVWCAFLLAYLYVFNYISFSFIDDRLITIEKVLFISEMLVNCSIITLIMRTMQLYSNSYRVVPQKLQHLYEQLRRLYAPRKHDPQLYVVLRRELSILTCGVVGFMSAVLTADLIYHKNAVRPTMVSTSVFILPNLLISLNLSQYWLGLRAICLLYRSLNNAISTHLMASGEHDEVELTTSLVWYQHEFASSFARKRQLNTYKFLDSVRSLYSDLDRLVAELVQIFGLLLLLNLMGSFLNLTIGYFAVYKFCDRPNKDGVTLFLYDILWVVLHTGRIFFILITNHDIIREKSRTCYILNEARTLSLKTEHVINRFLMQLMVRKQAPTACGIFDLDLLFTGGIASALGLYVMFLIQIDLGNQSLVGAALNNTR